MIQLRGRRIAVAAAIGLLLLGPAVGAQETDGQISQGWWDGPSVEPWITETSYSLDATCSAYGRLWVKEVKTSGITRMRLSFHKYGAYSPTVQLLAFARLTCDPTDCISPQGLITCATNVEGSGVTGGGGHVVNPGEENDEFYEEPPPSRGLTELGM